MVFYFVGEIIPFPSHLKSNPQTLTVPEHNAHAQSRRKLRTRHETQAANWKVAGRLASNQETAMMFASR